jgi:uncharacterized protein involved in exopolysaccharide biosynthesis
MTIKDIIRILRRNWLWLLLIPIVTAASIFYFTRNTVEEYSSDMVFYTGIASGFSISNENISSNYQATTKAYSNLLSLLNSRDTKREVALRLLASHLMLEKHDPTVLSQASYLRLQELIEEPLRQKLLGRTLEETVVNLTSYYHLDNSNEIYNLLHSEQALYSFEALSELKAYRLDGSDLVKVEYVSLDPAVCRNTLDLLSGTFIGKHKELMEGQNETVLTYFENATAKAFERLEAAEQQLLEFHKKNKIINYNDQASSIATEKQLLAQQYNELEMQYGGAYAALKAVEEKLKDRGATKLYSQEIMQLKNQLSQLNTQIAEQEVYTKGQGNAAANAQLARLKEEASETAARIQETMNKYYSQTHSVEGINNTALLDDWIKHTVLVEEIKGKLVTMGKQINKFEKEYAKMAPLGAELRKIEREIDMAQKEYFSLLNSLSESQISKEDIELTSNLKVVDQPYLPTKPSGSKRLLLVLLGACASLFVTLSGLLAVEYFDPTLKNSENTRRKTGLEVLGVLPILHSKNKQDQLKLQWAEDHLSRQLLLKMQQKTTQSDPYLLGVVSSLGSEGKSTLASILANKLNNLGVKTLSLLPDDHAGYIAPDNNIAFYSPLQGINQNSSLDEMANRHISAYNVVIIEFPALLEATYPVSLLKHLDLMLYTINAGRAWQVADKKNLKLIQEITNTPIEVFLNGVEPEKSEDLSGVQLSEISLEHKNKLLQAPKKGKNEPGLLAEALKT